MTSLFEAARGAPSNIFGAIEDGQNAAYNQKIGQFKLADLARMEQARPMMGQALQGDQGAFGRLAQVDPQSYMDIQKFNLDSNKSRADTQSSQLKAKQAEYERIATVMRQADTPEKWARTISYLEGQGADISNADRDFNNRDMVLAQGESDAAEMGLNPIYGTDANGNTVAYQLSKSGGISPVNLPDGVRLSPGIKTVGTGTGTQIRDSKTGQLIDGGGASSFVPKDIVGEQSAQERGKIQGQAQGNLPGAMVAAENVKQQIDDVLNDPDLNSVIGYNKYRPEALSSNEMVKVRGKIQRLGGQAFLEARTMLKGGGAITDFESKRAEQAFSMIESAIASSDVETLKTALTDFRDAVGKGIAKLEASAGGGVDSRQGGNPFENDPQFSEEVGGFQIGASSTNPQTGEKVYWDGNGWRSQ